jgi:hypothetical protein
MAVNKKWHDKHRMPANATIEKQIQWHTKHAKNCGCRPIPESVLTEMKKRGLA